ncbi:MAG: hypothetical protein IPG77_15505 [Betaproteobacteria bacterium]|nr:hypothetical protein [Betaproteobacteria bacterium]
MNTETQPANEIGHAVTQLHDDAMSSRSRSFADLHGWQLACVGSWSAAPNVAGNQPEPNVGSLAGTARSARHVSRQPAPQWTLGRVVAHLTKAERIASVIG